MNKKDLTDMPVFIAHAGGGLNGIPYTNSIEALEMNAPFYDLFEMDFIFTSDGEMVCTHDWGETFEAAFGIRAEKPLTLAEFEKLAGNNSRYTNCTAYTFAEWVRRNPAKLVVPDIKSDNVSGLKYLTGRFPDIKKNLMAQIYHPHEHEQVRGLGFKDIMWTLYRYEHADDHDMVVRAAADMNIRYAAMPDTYAEKGLAMRLKDELNIRTYVHTVNDMDVFRKMQGLGVYGVFTDTLK